MGPPHSISSVLQGGRSSRQIRVPPAVSEDFWMGVTRREGGVRCKKGGFCMPSNVVYAREPVHEGLTSISTC